MAKINDLSVVCIVRSTDDKVLKIKMGEDIAYTTESSFNSELEPYQKYCKIVMNKTNLKSLLKYNQKMIDKKGKCSDEIRDNIAEEIYYDIINKNLSVRYSSVRDFVEENICPMLTFNEEEEEVC